MKYKNKTLVDAMTIMDSAKAKLDRYYDKMISNIEKHVERVEVSTRTSQEISAYKDGVNMVLYYLGYIDEIPDPETVTPAHVVIEVHKGVTYVAKSPDWVIVEINDYDNDEDLEPL